MDHTREYGQFLASQNWDLTHPHAVRDYNEYDLIHNGFTYHLVCDDCEKSFRDKCRHFDAKAAGFIILVSLDSDGYLTFEDNRKVHFKDAVPILKSYIRKDRQPFMDLVVLAPHQVSKKYKLEIHNLTTEAGITHTSWE